MTKSFKMYLAAERKVTEIVRAKRFAKGRDRERLESQLSVAEKNVNVAMKRWHRSLDSELARKQKRQK